MRMISLLLGVVGFCGNALSAPCTHTKTAFRCAEYISNYDGDTITFRIPNVPPIIGEKIPVRVNGVDAPELRSQDDCERDLAEEAKEFVKQKMQEAKRIDLNKIQRGKYFRIVADVVVDGVSLSEQLIDKGYAYPYDGGTKHPPDWCSL